MNHDTKGRNRPTFRLRTLVLALLLALFGASALAQEGAQEEDAAQQNAAAQESVVADDETVIQLGADAVITKAEFEQEFERATRALALQQGLPYNEETRQLFQRFRADFLDQLATRNALLEEAKARGLTITDQEVDQQIAQVRENLGEDQFQQAVEDLGYDTVEAFRESVRQGLLTQMVIDELRAGIEVTDEQVQAFFEQNQDLFGEQQLEQVREQVRALLIDERLTEQFAGLQQQHDIQTFPERVVVATQQPAGVAGGGEAEEPEGAEEPPLDMDDDPNTIEGEIEGDVGRPEDDQPDPESEVDPDQVPAVEEVEEQPDQEGRQEGEDNQQDDR